MENCGFFGKNVRSTTKKRCENSQMEGCNPQPVSVGLKSAYQLQVEQAGGKPLGDGIGGIGEVLDQEVGDGVVTVDQIEDFEGSPDIIKIPEGVMTSAVAFFAIQQ
jgi:hypothetical protein